MESALQDVLDSAVVKHRCSPQLPPGTVLLELDRGPDNGRVLDSGDPSRREQGPRRLLLTAATAGPGDRPEDPRSSGHARDARDPGWSRQQLHLLMAAVTHCVDLVVYLPTGRDALRRLLEPSVLSDRYARLRPSTAQLAHAVACLRRADEQTSRHRDGNAVRGSDHAVVALALPGRPRGSWPVGQVVEVVEGCWLADSASWEATARYNQVRDAARQAGVRQLGDRPGGVALAIINADGDWHVLDDPLLATAPPARSPGSDPGSRRVSSRRA